MTPIEPEPFQFSVEKEGFRKIFLVNGDGGNWMNHWARLQWDSQVIRRLKNVSGMVFSGSNWDQEGGEPFLHDGAKMAYLEEEAHRFTDWSQYPEQDKLLGVVEFNWKLYRQLLYSEDGGGRQAGGIAEDFEQKIQALMKKVLAVVQ